jgi:hypothetical protein
MKKQLNVDLIQNELRGGSAFFPGYKGNDSPIPPTPTPQTHEPTLFLNQSLVCGKTLRRGLLSVNRIPATILTILTKKEVCHEFAR